MISAIPGLLVSITAAVTSGIVLAWLARPLCRRLMGARAAYALWLLPPVLVVAFHLPVPADGLAVPVTLPTTMAVIPGDSPTAAGITAETGADLAGVAWWAIWAAGAAGLLVLHSLRYRRFRRALTRHDHDTGRFGVRLPVLRARGGPSVFGLTAPGLALPHDFETRLTPAERRLILAHELTHLRRGDLIVRALAVVGLAAQWFNPTAHVAFRQFVDDQESACDFTLLQRHPTLRHRYARALCASAVQPASAAICAAHSRHPLTRRIEMMTKPLPSAWNRRAGLGLVGATLVVAAGLVWASRAAEPAPADGEAEVYRGTATYYAFDSAGETLSGSADFQVTDGARQVLEFDEIDTRMRFILDGAYDDNPDAVRLRGEIRMGGKQLDLPWFGIGLGSGPHPINLGLQGTGMQRIDLEVERAAATR